MVLCQQTCKLSVSIIMLATIAYCWLCQLSESFISIVIVIHFGEIWMWEIIFYEIPDKKVARKNSGTRRILVQARFLFSFKPDEEKYRSDTREVSHFFPMSNVKVFKFFGRLRIYLEWRIIRICWKPFILLFKMEEWIKLLRHIFGDSALVC